jgi:hypothetical protein
MIDLLSLLGRPKLPRPHESEAFKDTDVQQNLGKIKWIWHIPLMNALWRDCKPTKVGLGMFMKFI